MCLRYCTTRVSTVLLAEQADLIDSCASTRPVATVCENLETPTPRKSKKAKEEKSAGEAQPTANLKIQGLEERLEPEYRCVAQAVGRP